MKEKVNRSKQPNASSLRSKRRANRGFKSLEVSSRKHRRALRRQKWNCTISDVVYPIGEKHEINTRLGNKLSAWLHTAGGSMKFHKV